MLYALVTDIGCRRPASFFSPCAIAAASRRSSHATPRADRQQKNIIWERLDDVGGDTDFATRRSNPRRRRRARTPTICWRCSSRATTRPRASGAAAPLPTAVATEVTPAGAPADSQAALALPRADDADEAARAAVAARGRRGGRSAGTTAPSGGGTRPRGAGHRRRRRPPPRRDARPAPRRRPAKVVARVVA